MSDKLLTRLCKYMEHREFLNSEESSLKFWEHLESMQNFWDNKIIMLEKEIDKIEN